MERIGDRAGIKELLVSGEKPPNAEQRGLENTDCNNTVCSNHAQYTVPGNVTGTD